MENYLVLLLYDYWKSLNEFRVSGFEFFMIEK